MCDSVGLHIFLPPCQRFLSNMPEASQRDDLHALQPRPQEVRSRQGPVDHVQRTGRGTVVLVPISVNYSTCTLQFTYDMNH